MTRDAETGNEVVERTRGDDESAPSNETDSHVPAIVTDKNPSGLDPVEHVRELGRRARATATVLAAASAADKNRALLAIADAIAEAEAEILEANRADLDAARAQAIGSALLDRLELDQRRVASMAQGLRDVAAQADPIGSVSASDLRPSGLSIARMRVPLGVIGVIYESRPNVTADAAAICIKSGNVVILRGGSEAFRSNRVIARAVSRGLSAAGLPEAAVQLVDTTDRAAVGALLALDEDIDVIIPRGGKSLVSRISAEARVPVIKHLDGICHTYIDAWADARRAVEVALNAKTYRYGICGATETLLVHADLTDSLLADLVEAFTARDVELRVCERVHRRHPELPLAAEEDWRTEYLAPILSVKLVDDLDAAIAHIRQYGSGHTDAIVTDHIGHARRFQREVDSSSVLVNAATCFADGAEYGLGAEIGISTDRLHVRGPVGVLGLTTEKYVVTGDYTVRG